MVALIKYKPVYRVTVEEEEVGYIANRYEFEKRINENLIENDDSVVSSEIEGKPFLTELETLLELFIVCMHLP